SWQQEVVRVEKDDDLSLAQPKSRIERRRLTAVLLQDRDDPLAVGRYDFPRLVRGPVVHHDHFGVGVSLRQGSVDGVSQEPAVVVIVNDDARQRGAGHDRSLPTALSYCPRVSDTAGSPCWNTSA